MANMCTLAVTEDEYHDVVFALAHGFTHDGIMHRPNPRAAFAVKLEYGTGMRISDIVRLRFCDIVKDGDRFRLDVKEKKTRKKRTFRISQAIYDAINDYCAEFDIPKDRPIIGGTEYGIQKRLKQVGEYLGLERFGSHSIRKAAATRIYELSGKDIIVTQHFLQHSSPTTTAGYLASCGAVLDEVLEKLTV